MIKTLIVADDSTGANASAILLNQLNFTTLSLINYAQTISTQGYDGIAVSTDSRAVKPQTAQNRVREALEQYEGRDIPVLNKRIDSTLRGNIGSELDVFLEVFPKKKIAIVPGFPDSNRFCEDGKLYVGDTLLENTDVAKDPKMPITSSDVKTLFKKQFNGSLANISLEDVRSEKLDKHITALYKDHDGIIFDATTNEDIETIADALVSSGQSIVTVDAGPFTYAFTKATLRQKEAFKKRYLYLVGSVTQTTTTQLERAQDDDDFSLHPVDARKMMEQTSAKKEIERVLDAIREDKSCNIILTTNTPFDPNILDLFEASKHRDVSVDNLSKMINNHLGELLERAYTQHETFQGVFASGGDTALSFLDRVGASGIQLLNQVIPLCVYGKIVGGRMDGIPIITKGGMIGDSDVYMKIKQFLQEVDNYG